jgi:hypothetical protein
LKKLLNISLVLLILFNSAGYIFAYWQLKVIFKKSALKKIEQSLTNNELHLFITDLNGIPFSGSGAQRVNEKEFRKNNEMFDIVRFEIKDSVINYYCIKDEDESNLEIAFISYVEGSSSVPYGAVPVKSLMKNLSNDWYSTQENDLSFFTAEVFTQTEAASVYNFYISIPVPPPRNNSC